MCKKPKPVSEFYKSKREKDGHQTYCKICDREYKRKYIQTPKATERIRKYNQSEHGKEIIRKVARKYKTSHREELRRKGKIHYHLNPEKAHSKYIVYKAIKKGELLTPSTYTCTYCLKPAIKYHHHLGYSQEHCLSVLPICNSCHTLIHLATVATIIPSL